MQHSVLMLLNQPSDLDESFELFAQQYDLYITQTMSEAYEILEREWIHVLVCDEAIGDGQGRDWLHKVHEQWPDIMSLLLTDNTSLTELDSALSDIALHQCLFKPVEPHEVMCKLKNACDCFQLQRDYQQLKLEKKLSPESQSNAIREQRRVLQARFNWDMGLVRAPDSIMNKVCDTIAHVAPFPVNIVLMGESGTGKEVCARAIHNNSLRRDNVFVAENCATLPDELLESELFGHKRGAFTGANEDRIGLFEQANGGTILLDEIGEVSPAFQVKLLRVLQEGQIRPLGCNHSREVDVRVIAATNRDLELEVKEGRFRQDLFYRLSTFIINLPPLRDRAGDIASIANSVLQDSMMSLGKKVKGISPRAMQCMEDYHWPGNVRELQNEIKRMLVMAQGAYLDHSLLSSKICKDNADSLFKKSTENVDASKLSGSLKDQVEILETKIILDTLERHSWNKSRTADELGLSRVGLRNKLDRYGLEHSSHIPQEKTFGAGI